MTGRQFESSELPKRKENLVAHVCSLPSPTCVSFAPPSMTFGPVLSHSHHRKLFLFPTNNSYSWSLSRAPHTTRHMGHDPHAFFSFYFLLLITFLVFYFLFSFSLPLSSFFYLFPFTFFLLCFYSKNVFKLWKNIHCI
jgi:hypothetical protein